MAKAGEHHLLAAMSQRILQRPLVTAAAAAAALVGCGDNRAPTIIERSVSWELRAIEGRSLTLRLQLRVQGCSDRTSTGRPSCVLVLWSQCVSFGNASEGARSSRGCAAGSSTWA
jgi:hypothetical protein